MARPRGPSRDAHAVLQEHRSARVNERDDVHLAEGERPHLRRPSELLVAREDLPAVEVELRRLGAQELEVPGALESRVVRFELPEDEALSDLLDRLRVAGEDRRARVAPHHVFSGLPYIQGGPAGFPTAADDSFEPAAGERDGPQVAVLDTGYTPKLHPWLDARVDAAPATLEETDVHPRNGWLDDEAGHGTFIAGLILDRAPTATIRIAKVLDSEGYGSELALAGAILEQAAAGADIVNLSLGCYTHDDQPPVALAEALRHLPATTVVVAAAGNDATHRPLWPAAHKRAIAVAAVDDRLRRARFSNYGWWVDAAAPAVDVLSTFLDFTEDGRAAAVRGRVPQSFRGWARWSGTSFAAPRVAGAIAAAMARDGHPDARAAAAAVLAGSTRPADPDIGVVLAV